MFYPNPQLCLFWGVDERCTFLTTGDFVPVARLRQQNHNGRALLIGDDVLDVERWHNPDHDDDDSTIWVARTRNGFRLCTDDEDVAARIAIGLPVPFWADEDPRAPEEVEICAD
ncbi:MAG: hypothetical protein M5R40_15775 [Anaerolineae bacterium]|nr:hypothetical protein [Anaerolineae bacterium]